MKGPVKLSVVIITFNEEFNIKRCLESVKEIADEIIVVDSFSTDKTKEICLSLGVKFITNTFEGHIEQKNYALTHAQYDHILSLDADEAVSPRLLSSIKRIKQNWEFDGYVSNRLSSYCGQWIRYCGWYPDKKLRLFNKNKGKWGGTNPHDKYLLYTDNVKRISGDILHYTYHSIPQHIEQVNFFTDIGAKSAFKKGKKANVIKIFISPLFRFFRDYILKGGFMDGYYGFVICTISAHATFLKYIKLKELSREPLDYKFFKSIVISRTDNLGDVVLTLPLAGIIKSLIPQAKVYFIGKSYTRPVIESSLHIDGFIDRETIVKDPAFLNKFRADVILHVYPDKEVAKIAKEVGIEARVGTSHRWFHLLYCNKLINFTRENSEFHEAALNTNLLRGMGIEKDPDLYEIKEFYGMNVIKPLGSELKSLLSDNKINVMVHPKSKGSAREWPLDKYNELIEWLPESRYKIFVSGTAEEGQRIMKEKPEIFGHSHVTDLTGKCSLEELISFINAADGIVACSTGPLHIAAALNKNVCGIYSPMKPIHPGRWAPLGKKASFLVLEKDCSDCRVSENCACIQSIQVAQVADMVNQWKKN